MIEIQKIHHRDRPRIFLKYTYNTKTHAIVKIIKNSMYTDTYKGFYFPLTKKQYNLISNTLNINKLEFSNSKEIDSEFNSISEHEKQTREYIIDFVDYMKYRNYSKSTIKTYSNMVYIFLGKVKKDAEDISITDIEQYNKQEIIDRGFSLSSQNQLINALKLFFKRNNLIAFNVDDIERPRKSNYLPTVLSKKEIKSIFGAINNLKHKTILSLIYSSGLRIGETLKLKINDIDSNRNVIIIRQSKGYKDRIVGLSPRILELLREYYKIYNPKEYLFEGQKGGMYTTSSVRSVFKNACRKAGIKKQVRVHNLRHSYATHLLESGTDLRYIQDILGHKDPKTTMIYTQVSNRHIKKIVSPFDLLDE